MWVMLMARQTASWKQTVNSCCAFRAGTNVVMPRQRNYKKRGWRVGVDVPGVDHQGVRLRWNWDGSLWWSAHMSRGGRRCTVLCVGTRRHQKSSPHRYNYPNRCGWNRRTLSAGPRSRGIDGDGGGWNCGGGSWCSCYCIED